MAKSIAPGHSIGPIRIRRARAADLAALVLLENASFAGDRLSSRQWRAHVDSDSALVLVALDAGDVVGAALVFLRRGSRVARLYSIAVADAARGRGVGKRLLRRAESTARERGARTMRLEVRAGNAPARTLYEAVGYRRIGTLPGYYEDGSDGWRYERSLSGASPARIV